MKRKHVSKWAAIALTAMLAWACSDPVSNNNSGGGATGDTPPGSGSVGGTDAAKVNFEGSSVSLSAGDVYNPADALTTPDAAPTYSADSSFFYAGSKSLKIVGTVQQDKYDTASGTSTLNSPAKVTEFGARIKIATIANAGANLDLADKVFSARVFVPTGSPTTAVQIALQDDGSQQAIGPAISVTAGKWTTVSYKADSTKLNASGKLKFTSVDSTGAFLADGAYSSATFSASTVAQIEFRAVGGAVGAAGVIYVDSITWADTATFAATSAATISDTSTSGTGTDKVTVTLTAGSSGADAIYYTTNGVDPTAVDTNKYTAPFEVTVTGTVLKVLTVKAGLANSSIVSKTYTIVPSRTVTFDLNYPGATGAPASVKVASGSVTAAPTAPTRANFAFLGWFTEAAGTNQFAFTTAVTADLTLYGKWSSTIVSYSVTFDLNYPGSTGAPADASVVSGSTTTAPTAPTRSGYIFKGWYTEAANTTAFSFTTALTANTTLYAKWVQGVSMTFSAATLGNSGGVASATPTYNADGSVTYVANYQYGGGGMNFFINSAKTAVDLSSYTSIVVSYSVTASRPSVTNKLVFKAFSASDASYFSNNTALDYPQFDTPGAKTLTKTSPTGSAVFALGLCINDNGYAGDNSGTTASGVNDGVSTTFDNVTITIHSIELLK